jgi:NIMA (never in mitosis gene a)-related kinase
MHFTIPEGSCLIMTCKQEVSLLQQLHHPNIVEYVERFELDDVLHIVMHYCEGGDLAAHIKQKSKEGSFYSEKVTVSIRFSSFGHSPPPPPPLQQILDWHVQISLALEYMHTQRILHRDLKTRNVFLTKNKVVKLGDFGIAKVLDCTLEQANTVVGTPYYMSKN